MSSLHRELSGKLKQDSRLTRRSVTRFDLGLLLFNAGDSLCELWEAADRYVQSRDDEACARLGDAVEKLRPLFGERG